MNINNYKIFNWIGDKDINDISKKEAKEKFNLFLENKDTRINELKKLVESTLYQEQDIIFRYQEGKVPLFQIKEKPKKMTLDYSLESIQALSDWLSKYTKEYAKTITIPKKIEQDIFKDLTPFWKSVASDIAIYYFEVLRHNFDSNLSWTIETEPVMTYNYPSITGWKKEQDYKDGIVFFILREIFILIMDKDLKEDFLLYRLNYHMEDLL